MTDNYIRTTMFGAVIGASFLAITYFTFEVILKPATPEVPAPNSNFEVVDTYKGCDVVRWSENSIAEYKYFLNCHDTDRN
jgi:hypothetical protein